MTAGEFKKPFFWTLFLIFVWFPILLMVVWALLLAQSNIEEGAASLIQADLSGKIIRFKQILDPCFVLTERLQKALELSSKAENPSEWHRRILGAFPEIPANGIDLLVTDGKKIIPEYPGFSLATFSQFLASMTARSESLADTRKSIEHLRKTQNEIDFFGSARYSFWRWIDLPFAPGIPTRIFDDCWRGNLITSMYSGPRNTFVGFGKVTAAFPGWKYLLLFHRQEIPQNTILKMSRFLPIPKVFQLN